MKDIRLLSASSETSDSIGLVGLGLMGSALAERFLNSGFNVIGFDTNRSARCQRSRWHASASSSLCRPRT
ncbi:MAG: hypothetical protein DME26_09950 [Verrucomicrobia bacterium]|nr:MAG: hypothetical protein DME26_09950 [Verrucomicrobiota bacterium]